MPPKKCYWLTHTSTAQNGTRTASRIMTLSPLHCTVDACLHQAWLWKTESYHISALFMFRSTFNLSLISWQGKDTKCSFSKSSISHGGYNRIIKLNVWLCLTFTELFTTGSWPVQPQPTAAGHWAAPLEKRIKSLPQWHLSVVKRAQSINHSFPSSRFCQPVWGSELATVRSQMHWSLLKLILFLELLSGMSLFGVTAWVKAQHCPP